MNTKPTSENIVIAEMTKPELETVKEWAAEEGWNPGKHDAEVFFETDPKGFFVAKIGETLAGAISAVAYDDNFGFIGFFIVRPKFRHLGIGLKLGQHALTRLRKQNAGVDGVLAQVENYERSGLKIAYKNIRYKFFKPAEINIQTKNIYDLKDVPFVSIAQFDRRFFPADRKMFLKNWFAIKNSSTCVRLEKGIVKGFGSIREAHEGWRIGPLFADSVEIAEEILCSLVSKIKNAEPVFIDIPEPNNSAQKLIDRYKMKKVFETARMYTKNAPDIFIDGIFGVTSYELG